MVEGIALIGACAAALAGFAWLALAMQEHWQQVYGENGQPHPNQVLLRMFGVGALLVSGILCFVADRPSMAALVWILFMAFGSVTVALILAWKPRLLRIVFPVFPS